MICRFYTVSNHSAADQRTERTKKTGGTKQIGQTKRKGALAKDTFKIDNKIGTVMIFLLIKLTIWAKFRIIVFCGIYITISLVLWGLIMDKSKITEHRNTKEGTEKNETLNWKKSWNLINKDGRTIWKQ